MELEFGLTNGLFNTQFAPLALIACYCKQEEYLAPLNQVSTGMKSVKFTQWDKLSQVFVSILAGCDHLAEVNTRLVPDRILARSGGVGSIYRSI